MVGGVVCTVVFLSNPIAVLRLYCVVVRGLTTEVLCGFPFASLFIDTNCLFQTTFKVKIG